MKQIFGRHKFKQYIWSILSVLTVSAFPPLFLYCRNAEESGFLEILPILLIFCGISIILLVIISRLNCSIEKAALIASVCMAVFLHFSFLEYFMRIMFSGLKFWHTIPIVIVLCLYITYGINYFVNRELAIDLVRIQCIVFGGLIILNFAMSLPQTMNHIRMQIELGKISAQQERQESSSMQDMPNVYFLIFDEYANFIQMEEYYGYDNAMLKDFLEEHNFGISYNSHNESKQSNTIQTNLVNLDYVVKDDTRVSEKDALRKNGYLFELFRQKGYDVQILESGSFYGGTLPGRDGQKHNNATTIGGESLSDILIKRSMAYPLWEIFISRNGLIEEKIKILADYLSKNTNLPQRGTFTLAYFKCPHQPFIADENGNMVLPVSQWQNWEDPKYYLGQYKYTTKEMLQILENLVVNDPESVIIVQSDHGARYGAADHFPTREIQTNILNAVYYQGNDIDIEGLTGINTLRIVLNKMFDMDYEMLSLPEWRYQ